MWIQDWNPHDTWQVAVWQAGPAMSWAVFRPRTSARVPCITWWRARQVQPTVTHTLQTPLGSPPSPTWTSATMELACTPFAAWALIPVLAKNSSRHELVPSVPHTQSASRPRSDRG
jgi:hypothetical protein